jgi:AAA domain
MNAPFDHAGEAIAEGMRRAETAREQDTLAGELELLIGEPADREEDIPRRNYVVSGYIQRGVLTEIVGPGGHGKSQLLLAWAVALALGLSFGGFIPSRPMRVLTLDVEDDIPEQQRRCAAMLRQFGRCKADLGGRLKLLNPNKAGLMVTLDPATGKLGHTRLLRELLELIETFNPDLVMLNPLGELHDVTEENNNAALRRIAAELRVIAKAKEIGILLAHHTRKGNPEHGNPDAGRGASSVSGVVRKSFTLYGMTEGEAASWKITRPNLYFRLDGAKANYDAKNPTEWFERVPIVLGNGDTVPLVAPWTPPANAITDELITNLLAVIKTGDKGQPWSRRLGKYDRSIARPMERLGIVSRVGQLQALDALFANGVVECTYMKPNRDAAKGLRHPDGGPSTAWKE